MRIRGFHNNMINPWFKFYGGEYLSDPKIGSLTPQERSCWITLLCLSSTSSVPGIIEYLTVEVLLEKSGIKFDPYHPEEWDSCISILAKFERMKMIKMHDGGSIEIVNWGKRQESAMTVTERVRKYRMKSKENQEDVTNVTNGNETDNDRIEENRIEESIIIGSQSSKRFIKPTFEQLTQYCLERKNSVNPQKFLDHYESNGWKIGGKGAMKDWKAAVRTWESNSFGNGKGGSKPVNVLSTQHSKTLSEKMRQGALKNS